MCRGIAVLSILRLGKYMDTTPGDLKLIWKHRAGAHWLPHSRAHEPVICDWDVQTYDYWLEMIQREDEDRKLLPSGLKV